MKNIEQLTLGNLIGKIEAIEPRDEYNDPKSVQYDFGTAIPTDLDSWRGIYAELALGYKLTGYDDHANSMFQVTVESFLKELKSGIGQTYHGWKGGEFKMDVDTRLWVANRGNSGNTGIYDVLDIGYAVILQTAYFEI